MAVPREPAETTLLLVRHGATAWNLLQPYVLQGRRMDPPLAPDGRAQAAVAAAALRDWPIAAVYCSRFRRAWQTADAIGQPHGLAPQILRGIEEIDCGQWECLTWDQARAKNPVEVAAFFADPARHGYLGGENLDQLVARVVPPLEAIAARHPGETICVVAHNSVNRSALAYWLGLPAGLSRKLPQENAAWNVVRFRGGEAKVATINATGRLSAS